MGRSRLRDLDSACSASIEYRAIAPPRESCFVQLRSALSGPASILPPPDETNLNAERARAGTRRTLKGVVQLGFRRRPYPGGMANPAASGHRQRSLAAPTASDHRSS